ncbi:MAG: hypothetical protein RR382_13815 [Tannerellaceae bacterium]
MKPNWLDRLGDKLFNWEKYKERHDQIISLAIVLLLLGWVMAW